jgi:hypothetical protein
MQQLQNSILDGSPYFFTREERFADPPPFLDEAEAKPDQSYDMIATGKLRMVCRPQQQMHQD